MNLFRHLTLAATLLVASQIHAATYDGIVQPFKEVVVAAPVQSTIDSIEFKEGDLVKAGDVLAKLYGRIEELDMQRAKAALEKKEFDFNSSKNLYAEKIISEDEALKNKIELELARLQYEQATEVFRQRTVLAPINGLVVDKLREVGESVTATQPMFRLVDISKLYVLFYIRSEDLDSFKIGETVAVTSQIGSTAKTVDGTIDFIDPRVDAASGLLRVKVLVDNTDGSIKPGLRATVAPKTK